MKPLYLKFKDKNQCDSYLLSIGFNTDKTGVLYHESISIDVIGVINGDIIVDDCGDFVSQMPDLPGWHVNLLVPDDFNMSGDEHIMTVKTPVRKFAGY